MSSILAAKIIQSVIAPVRMLNSSGPSTRVLQSTQGAKVAVSDFVAHNTTLATPSYLSTPGSSSYSICVSYTTQGVTNQKQTPWKQLQGVCKILSTVLIQSGWVRSGRHHLAWFHPFLVGFILCRFKACQSARPVRLQAS